MSILRIQHNKDRPFAQINKAGLEDSNLSWGAKGVWAYLISRPDNWQVSVYHLCKIYKGDRRGNGLEGVRAIIKELIQEGYITAERIKDDYGKFDGIDYVVHEEKQKIHIEETRQLKEKVPQRVKPHTAKPCMAKPTQTIKNDKDKEFKKNDINVTEDRSFFQSDSIVPFDPETFKLPNGKGLSLQMRRAIAKYSPQDRIKLQANVEYFKDKVRKGTQMDDPEKYLQSCIKNNYAKKQDNVGQNKLYAMWVKEEYKLRKLEILKTVVRFKRSDSEPSESLSFSLPVESFSAALDQYIQKNKE